MVPVQQTIDGEAWPFMKVEQHKVFNGDLLVQTSYKDEKNAQINYEIANSLIPGKINRTNCVEGRQYH